MKALLSNTIKIGYILRDLSFVIFFITIASLYPVIMYKFDVVYVPMLALPSYAMGFLLVFFFAKTIIGIFCLIAVEDIKHIGLSLNLETWWK